MLSTELQSSVSPRLVNDSHYHDMNKSNSKGFTAKLHVTGIGAVVKLVVVLIWSFVASYRRHGLRTNVFIMIFDSSNFRVLIYSEVVQALRKVT